MWLAAGGLGGCAAASGDKGGLPVGTGEAEGGRAVAPGRENETWQPIGALAGAVVAKLRIRDRAPCTTPRTDARAPAGGTVANGAGRRPQSQEISGMPDIGTTHVIATILAGLARERSDRGEELLQYIEAEAGYLRERMPSTADAMRIACTDARRLRAAHRDAAE